MPFCTHRQLKIIKRDGRQVDFDREKISKAISRAMIEVGCFDKNELQKLTDLVLIKIIKKFFASSSLCKTKEQKVMSNIELESQTQINKNILDQLFEQTPENKNILLNTNESKEINKDFFDSVIVSTVEDIQDMVESVLMENHPELAKRYILYRAERTRIRERNSDLMKIFNELTNLTQTDIQRENANIDCNTAMGTMLKYGSEGAKYFYESCILPTDQSKAHHDGDIHIHDFDFYTLTTTCCQIDLIKLFKNGFSTGHGFLREPNSIRSYAALACIAIQSNQNDQHGGQSIPNFDYAMADGVKKTFKHIYMSNLFKAINLVCPEINININQIKDLVEKNLYKLELDIDQNYLSQEKIFLSELNINDSQIKIIQDFVFKTSKRETENEVYQAMEALIHNLNTMHSRAGAQTPFSSINYGTDTSPEGRMIIKNILLATESGLGKNETAIFPIQIFKVKDGVNYNPEDKNYDLFKLACRVSSKRLFPNFSFLDAPFNIKYYKPNHPETEVVYMGCRTRVMGNHCGPEIAYGRGNLSFTSINLPRIAIKNKKNIDCFFEELESKLNLVTKQLTDRFHIQCEKKVKNFPFLMGQGIWLDSENLNPEDKIGDVLKHGTLSVGFIGLAETLKSLIGKHHGESSEAQKLGLEIIKFMRDYLDNLSQEKNLNYTLLATPAEALSGRFVKLDKIKFGLIPGVTDRQYYTNSFHVPVYYKISAYDKIKIEAPYHELTNAGHITYVELDGNVSNNTLAFEKVIRTMKEAGIGYGSINHPVDRDPVCGYNGIINEICPGCGRRETPNNKFERIRRITGYLVGTLDRFNDAKKSEEKERVKHSVSMFIQKKFDQNHESNDQDNKKGA